MFYSTIGLLAILILFIVNPDILFRSRLFDKPAYKVYRRFLFAVLAYYITDVLWGILEEQKLSTALFWDTTAYFVAMAVGIALWAEFIAAYLEERSFFSRVLKVSGRVIAGLMIGVTVLNIFTPVLFSVDSSCVYKAFPARYVILVGQIVFLIAISVYAILVMFRTALRTEKSIRFRILACFGMIMAGFLFIQLWFPYLPLYAIGYMLGTCMLHSFVLADEKEDRRREEKEAEKIAELRDRFRSLLDNMPGMTFTKDAKTGRYLACNQAFAEYAGKENPEAVVGLTDAEIFDAVTAAHFMEDDKTALSLAKPYVFYEDVPDAKGDSRHFQTTKIKYKDTAGRLCVLGMCQNITDLVSIKREQAMTREAYEKAVDTGLMYNHIAQTLARDYTQMYYVNTDTEEFTEYQRKEELHELAKIRSGWHFFTDAKAEISETVYPEDRDDFLQAMNRKKLMKALSHRDTVTITYRRMVRNKPYYTSMKVSRMEKDENHIIVCFTDVDAQMREAIAKNELLSSALSSANAAKSARTTFLDIMAHEILTPINAIIGLETMALKKEELDGEIREIFKKIGDSAESLLTLVNNILDMSHIESGREFLDNTAFSLRTLLAQVSAQIGEKCSEKGLTYEENVAESLEDSFIGDDMKLSGILTYILFDVINHTEDPGSITLTVEKRSESDGFTVLGFTIRNTGRWLGKTDLSTGAFGTATEKETSLGKNVSIDLSLTITRRILETMNGTVENTYEEGKGLEIALTVTLKKGEKKEADKEKTAE